MHSLLVVSNRVSWFFIIFLFFPDDFNRVVLDTIEGEHDSDYINASYVDVSSFSTSLVNCKIIVIFRAY